MSLHASPPPTTLHGRWLFLARVAWVVLAVTALANFGGIVVLQRLFVVLTDEKSILAVVASTLLIAALFNHLDTVSSPSSIAASTDASTTRRRSGSFFRDAPR